MRNQMVQSVYGRVRQYPLGRMVLWRPPEASHAATIISGLLALILVITDQYGYPRGTMNYPAVYFLILGMTALPPWYREGTPGGLAGFLTGYQKAALAVKGAAVNGIIVCEWCLLMTGILASLANSYDIIVTTLRYHHWGME